MPNSSNSASRWVTSFCEATEGRFIAVDGKVLRGSYGRDSRQSAIHRVGAFCAQNKLVLGQVETDDKSNEIKAIPELVKLLGIKGCLISIDAIACQKALPKQ